MKTVKIINYFTGNIYSVAKAFEYFDCRVKIINSPKEIKNTEFLILPGVGAFGDGIANLKTQNLINPILEFIDTGRPFLGICLGMQLLFSTSTEFGIYKGLDIISGQVKKLPVEFGMKIPHIGWQNLELLGYRESSFGNHSVLSSLPKKVDMYFVHSFAAYPDNKALWLSSTSYGKHSFCSTVMKENVIGCQYHPEKSGKGGLSIIKNFLNL